MFTINFFQRGRVKTTKNIKKCPPKTSIESICSIFDISLSSPWFPCRTWKASWSNSCRRIKSWAPRRGGNAQKIHGKIPGKIPWNCPRNRFGSMDWFVGEHLNRFYHGFYHQIFGGFGFQFSHHPILWEVCDRDFPANFPETWADLATPATCWVLICTLCGRVTWNSSGSAEGSCWSCWGALELGRYRWDRFALDERLVGAVKIWMSSLDQNVACWVAPFHWWEAGQTSFGDLKVHSRKEAWLAIGIS